MCAIFGLIDYENCLSKKQREHMINTLSRQCQVRGTDATGISYLTRGKLVVYKKPLPASRINFHIPIDSRVIIGHTRLATQGDETKNYNNHPFNGNCGDTKFSLCHNGVIHNDKILKRTLKLPDTIIETDSYVPVQILSQCNSLSMYSLKNMVEQLEGSFCFSIIDNKENTYLVKGSNPLCIYQFAKGFYIYASTSEILKKAIKRLRLNYLEHKEIKISEGDILFISKGGQIQKDTFESDGFVPYYLGYGAYSTWGDDKENSSYIEELKEIANCFGVDEEEIDSLLKDGYTYDEIEEYLYSASSVIH